MSNPPSMDMSETAENHKFYNMFEDRKLLNAFKNLPKEDQDQYKKQGQHMYSKDYESIDINNNPQENKVMESTAYISEGLKSGLLPSQLDENEREIMRNVFGKLWYEKFGYDSENE
jgi:hypothetical protein